MNAARSTVGSLPTDALTEPDTSATICPTNATQYGTSATLMTTNVKSIVHQYSLRLARPENVAYLRKYRRTACPNRAP